jgi:hypothetical protein
VRVTKSFPFLALVLSRLSREILSYALAAIVGIDLDVINTKITGID